MQLSEHPSSQLRLAEIFNLLPQKTYELFRQYLEGAILVDLGGGVDQNGNNLGSMANFAQNCGAVAYINVDRWMAGLPTDLPTPFTAKQELQNPGGFQQFAVRADILDFVSHMQDDCAQFVLNKIESQGTQRRNASCTRHIPNQQTQSELVQI